MRRACPTRPRSRDAGAPAADRRPATPGPCMPPAPTRRALGERSALGLSGVLALAAALCLLALLLLPVGHLAKAFVSGSATPSAAASGAARAIAAASPRASPAPAAPRAQPQSGKPAAPAPAPRAASGSAAPGAAAGAGGKMALNYRPPIVVRPQEKHTATVIMLRECCTAACWRVGRQGGAPQLVIVLYTSPVVTIRESVSQ